ncbi:hypothetical protein V9T40_004337 [Parthenolecanium corni]|uniref:FOXO protein transactivation domain-containing protein n=1 Tax=Parthenolecanium corni TaxID=536013 RepID=A0AAN9U1U1_9HEMI
MRVQNEGTGKSSWWMLNPDAKPGKSTRRRATSMETSKFEKRRGRVKKKVDALRNGAIEAINVSPSSSVSETVDLFPEYPESPLLGYQPSPDFRTRASSNASSCSRLSPIPAIEPEWTLNYQNYVPADQLAGSLEQHMKINNGGGGNGSGEGFLFSTYQQPGPQSPQAQQSQQPQAQPSPITSSASGFSRTTFSQVTTPSSSQNCLIHPMQPCTCTFLTDLKSSLSPIVRTSNSSAASHQSFLTTTSGLNDGCGGGGSLMDQSLNLLDDLNINIESFDNDFECNVDEVIRHELSIGGSLDFNFSATGANGVLTSTPSSQTSSAAAAAAAATTAAAAAASSNRGQASYNDRSWVH